MIDRLIDQAIVSLLGTIAGLKVLPGAEDIEPPLETPWCVVHSAITGVSGRTPIYLATVTIELNSVTGQDAIANIDALQTAIDNLIGSGGDYSQKPGIITTGLRYLGWEAISRSQEETGDRRKNVRELLAFATLV